MNPAIHTLFEVYPADSLATVPLGLRVNELVYGRLDGADPVTGAVSTDPENQVAVAVAKARDLVERAGGKLADIGEITAVYDTHSMLGLVAGCWQAAFPGQATPRIDEVVASLPAGQVVELHCRARIAGASTEETGTASVTLQASWSRPAGQVLGPVIYGPMISAASRESGLLSGDDSLEQLRSALRNVGDFLRAAGSGWHEVARATVCMNPVNLPALNTAWAEIFPDPEDRAPHKYVPAMLPAGQLAAVQVMAIAGAPPRRVIELDTIRHGDWMTMSALTANVVTSSRIIAKRRDDAAEYTTQVLDNIEEVMLRAGGSLASLTQITAFIGEPSYRHLVESELKRRLGAGAQLPVLHYVEASLGGVKAPRMEITALV